MKSKLYFIKTFFKTVIPVILFLSVSQFIACQKTSGHIKTDITNEILTNKDSFFYLNTKNYPAERESLPVGIFDSGTGGLTVLDAIVNFDKFNNGSHSYTESGDGIKDFSLESFIYLGDQANMPYGRYSHENNTPLLKEHIIKDAQFLLGDKYYSDKGSKNYINDKSPVKAVVIACNTATAYGKSDIESFIKRTGLKIKVIGVIDAGVRGALEEFGKDENGCTGIFATAGTVASQGYVNVLNGQSRLLGYTGNLTVFQQAGIGLAGAIDGSGEYISPQTKTPREDYKGPSDKNPDSIIDTKILERYGFYWKNGAMLYRNTRENPENIQINSVNNYIAYHTVSFMEQLRKADNSGPLKVIILGCTHYPFFTEIFELNLKRLYNYKENGKYIYRKYMSENIKLVDPAVNTAKELYEHLKITGLFSNSSLFKSEFYISMPNVSSNDVQLGPDGTFTYEYKYGRKAGFIQQYVKRVPFSRKSIPEDIVIRLKEKTPFVYDMISRFNRKNTKMEDLPKKDRL